MADDILIQPTHECIHKENSFTGRQSHPHTIFKFLQAFSSLDEVRYYFKHPSFTHNEKSTNPYSYCDESRIGSALTSFVQKLVDSLNSTS